MKLKTRTNQPVYYKLPVSSNIQSLSDDLLNSLRVGDVVQKKTGNQKHCYVVTYKEEKKGICLTYVDCGYMETISYDYTDGHWVFNSKDVCDVKETIKTMSLEKGGILNTTGKDPKVVRESQLPSSYATYEPTSEEDITELINAYGKIPSIIANEGFFPYVTGAYQDTALLNDFIEEMGFETLSNCVINMYGIYARGDSSTEFTYLSTLILMKSPLGKYYQIMFQQTF